MRPFINCWKVIELSDAQLQQIKDMGFVGIRFDVLHAGEVEPSCEKLIEHELEGLMLINGGSMPLSHEQTVNLADDCASLAAGAVAFEIGNEPDISGKYEKDWDGFGRLVNSCAMAINGRFPVVSGGLFSTSTDGLEYLGYALRWMDPTVICGIHSYRQDGTPGKPHRRFRTRDAELQAIKQTANPRPVWCTEMGWHTASFDHGLFNWREKNWTDEEVLMFLVRELRLQATHGTEVTVVYQRTDGPTEEGIDRFGMVRTDGTLKPQAQCVRMAEV
jgi:hypothetical protein